jgi:hypothetical protein
MANGIMSFPRMEEPENIIIGTLNVSFWSCKTNKPKCPPRKNYNQFLQKKSSNDEEETPASTMQKPINQNMIKCTTYLKVRDLIETKLGKPDVLCTFCC